MAAIRAHHCDRFCASPTFSASCRLGDSRCKSRERQAGVPLTIGTDFANPFVAPGADVHTEMRLYRNAGIPPWAVLRMATNSAAETMGLGESIGRLSPGYEADIVFTLADPSRDVANIESVSGVLLNGVRYEIRALIVGRP